MDKISQSASYLPLKEYEKLAKICIFKEKNARRFLYSEDAISYIMYCMMLGEKRYNGMGTRSGYRMANGKYAVKSLLSNKISIDTFFKRKQSKRLDEIQLNITYNSYKISDMDLFEIIDFITNTDVLNETERYSLLSYFKGKNTEANIAKELNISQQAVSKAIQTGLKKMKMEFNDE